MVVGADESVPEAARCLRFFGRAAVELGDEGAEGPGSESRARLRFLAGAGEAGVAAEVEAVDAMRARRAGAGEVGAESCS